MSPLGVYTSFLLISFSGLIPALHAVCSVREENALLAFRNGSYERQQILAGWGKPQTSCCTWRGIGCSFERVISISLPSLMLRGQLQKELGEFSQLKTLDVSDNAMDGPLPPELGKLLQLEVLNLGVNFFSGSIPHSFSRLASSLQVLDLEHFSFEEPSVSPVIGKLVNLRKLVLSGIDTSVDGSMPGFLGDLKSLTHLSMSGVYSLTGSIPPALARLTRLQTLDLSGSMKLGGSIPQFLGAELEYLDLSRTAISGPVPASLSKLTKLKHLAISSTRISGKLPDELGELASLQKLIISETRLTGGIPGTFSNLKQLESLDLHSNRMSGQIPTSLSAIKNLRSMDFSRNRFTGGIPGEFLKLNRLEYFDVSSNQLQGKIPTGPPFSKMDASKFASNPGLCGAPLPACKP